MKNKKNKIYIIIEYILIYLLYILLSILPINLVSIIGGKVFQFLGPFTKAHKIAKKNYLHIFQKS